MTLRGAVTAEATGAYERRVQQPATVGRSPEPTSAMCNKATLYASADCPKDLCKGGASEDLQLAA